jgi:hypothetical protein
MLQFQDRKVALRPQHCNILHDLYIPYDFPAEVCKLTDVDLI